MGEGPLSREQFDTAFDSLPATIAILDDTGNILHTNLQWKEFGRNNGIAEGTSFTGQNYLDAARAGEDSYARRAVRGLEEVLAGERETFRLEYPCHSPDENRWFFMYASGFAVQDTRHLLVSHLDITDRKIREREVARFRKAVENAGHAVYIGDPDGEIQYVNPEFEAITGYTAEEAIGNTAKILHSGEMSDEYYEELWETISAGDVWEEVIVNRRKSGEIYWADQTIAPISEDGDPAGFVAVQHEITERKRRKEALRTAQCAGMDFLRADSIDEIARTFVQSVKAISSSDFTVYLHYQTESNVFEPIGSVGNFEQTMADSRAPTEGIIGEAWTEDRVLHTSEPIFPDAEHGTTHRVVEPIGTSGVLLRGFGTPPRSSEVEEILDLLIQNLEVAIERTSLSAQVRRQRSQLDAATSQLDQLLEVNEEIRRIANRLLRIDDIQALGDFVCRRLGNIEQFSSVWFGRFEWGNDTVRPMSTAGDIRPYLDEIILEVDTSEQEMEASLQAVDTREPVVINSIPEHVREHPWRQAAIAAGYASVVSIPVEYEGRLFGTISIYGDKPIDFPDQTLAALVDLGDTVGHAIHRIRQEESLISPNHLGVEYRVDDASMHLCRLGDELDISFTLHPYNANTGDELSLIGEIPAIEPEELLTAVDTIGDTLTCEITSESPSSLTVLFRYERTGVPEHIAKLGGDFQGMQVDRTGARITAVFPRTTNVRAITNALRQRYPSAELSRRWVTTDTTHSKPGDTESPLTDRQQEVIDLAVSHGYFEWPRNVSGEELATELDIDSSTVHRHLRVGLRKILADSPYVEGADR